MNTSFNSLQTGKCIQSSSVIATAAKRDNSVSIPFKRESVSKVEREPPERNNERNGFNSLQTGKCIQSDQNGLAGRR